MSEDSKATTEPLTKAHEAHKKEHPKLTKRNSLIENNSLARWVNNYIIKKMDKYAYSRSVIFFLLITFFLGRNLSIFISMFIAISIYLIGYRFVRFYLKRWLLYMLEFCYYGNLVLIYYLLFAPQSEGVWSIAFMCSTGALSWAAIIFDNQAQFGNTDYLTSSWIHVFPLITAWAVRWRHIIYEPENLRKMTYNLLDLSEVGFSVDVHLFKLIVLPIIFWFCWAVFYYLVCLHLLKDYLNNEKYCSGLGDFRDGIVKKLPKLLGDPEQKNLGVKYLIAHGTFFVLVMPVSLLCYYSFYVNTAFLLGIIGFISVNAGIKSHRYMEKLLRKIGEKAEKEN